MGRKFGGFAPFLGREGPARYLSNTRSPVLRPTYSKWHLDASSRLATIEMGIKLSRGLRPFLGMELVAWAEAYTSILKWHLDPCSHLAATESDGPKIGG